MYAGRILSSGADSRVWEVYLDVDEAGYPDLITLKFGAVGSTFRYKEPKSKLHEEAERLVEREHRTLGIEYSGSVEDEPLIDDDDIF
ncbi:hypothetical protein N9L26_01245 [Candidatus Pacebacteria bacterium]|nr:hypothetical protein [Candidatus Paceibacterota bacterium]